MSFSAMLTAKPAKSKAEIEEEARVAKVKAENEKDLADRMLVLNAIVNKATELGHKIEIVTASDFGRLKVTTADKVEAEVWYRMERAVDPKTSYSRFRRAYTGPYKFLVQDERGWIGGGSKGFNDDKATKAVEKIVSKVHADHAVEMRRKAENDGAAKSRRLCKEVTGSDYGNSYVDDTSYGDVCVKLRATTKFQVEAIIAAAVAAGVKVSGWDTETSSFKKS